MKLLTRLQNSVRVLGNVIAGATALAVFAFSGQLTALAAGPVFNAMPEDLPTLQVATAASPTWSKQTSASNIKVGDELHLLLWDHNSVVNSQADNVDLAIDLGGTTESTKLTATGILSASNAVTKTGAVQLGLVNPGKLVYETGSAIFYNTKANSTGGYDLVKGDFPKGVVADNIVNGGIHIGNQLGCWQYAHAVEIVVRVEAGLPAVTTNKTVERDGGSAPFGNTATAQPGDVVNFKVYFENSGTATGFDPEIIDTLDSRFTYVPNSSYILVKQNNQDYRYNLLDSRIGFAGQKITWGFENMVPNPSSGFYLIFSAKVAAASQFTTTTTLQNCATALFNAQHISKDTNCVTVTVPVTTTGTVSFSLRKEVTNKTLGDSLWYDQRLGSAGPGDTVSYRLILQNTGTAPANDVSIQDLLPAGVTYKGNATLNGKSVDASSINTNLGFKIPTVVNGTAGTQVLIFDAQINQACNGSQTIVNWGQVIYQQKIQARDDADIFFTCTRGLVITKQVKDANGNYVKDAGTVAAGQTLTYRVTVLNNGTTTDKHPIVRDLLPGNVTYVPGSMTIDDQKEDDSVVKAFLGNGMLITDLVPGLGKSIVFQVKVNACPTVDTVIINTAFAKADNVSEVSDTAKALEKGGCSTATPTPTPPTPTPSQPTPTAPGSTPTPTPKPVGELPHTGPEMGFTALAGLSGLGYTGRWYQLKKQWKKQAKNLDIL